MLWNVIVYKGFHITIFKRGLACGFDMHRWLRHAPLDLTQPPIIFCFMFCLCAIHIEEFILRICRKM